MSSSDESAHQISRMDDRSSQKPEALKRRHMSVGSTHSESPCEVGR